jgi:hypothetical protein
MTTLAQAREMLEAFEKTAPEERDRKLHAKMVEQLKLILSALNLYYTWRMLVRAGLIAPQKNMEEHPLGFDFAARRWNKSRASERFGAEWERRCR